MIINNRLKKNFLELKESVDSIVSNVSITDFQKKEILEPYSGPRYRITPRLTPLGRTIAAQIRACAAVALDLASQGITDEMRGNMYHCLDLIAANMRGICEEGLMEK